MMSIARRMAVSGAIAIMMWAPAVAQQQTASPKNDAATLAGTAESASHSWTTEQLVTSSVHDAWMLSGRNEDQFFEMVKELAAMSAQKRGLVLPEKGEAGKKAGELIKKQARKDPDQLLYAVVDYAVAKTGTKTGGTTAKK